MKLRALIFILAAACGFAAFVLPEHPPLPKVNTNTKQPRAPVKAAPVLDGSAQALRDTFGLPAGPRRSEMMKRQAEALNKLSPEAALGLVLSMPPGSARDEAARVAFVRLVKDDLAKAFAWAEKHRELAPMARTELSAALAKLAAKDGPAAWALLTRLRRMDYLASGGLLIERWAGNGPRGAATFGMTLAPGIERKDFMVPVLRAWAKNDTQGLLTWLRTQPPDEMSAYFSEGFALDPKATWAQLMAMAEVLPAEAFSNYQWANAVTAALSDSTTRSAMMQSVRSIADPELRDQTWLGAVKASAASNPDEASRYIAEIQNPKTRAFAASTLAGHLATNDPAAAIAFANAQPDADAGGAAIRSALGTWLISDPAAARSYIAENLAQLDVDLLDRITGSATRDNPAEFASWALTLQPSPQQTRLLRNLSTWLHYEPDEFRAWATSHAYTPGFQNALPGLLEAANHYYKPSSASLATVVEYMTDAAQRQQAAVKLMQSWRATNPQDAARWHDAQVQAGRISAVPDVPLEKASSEADKVERVVNEDIYVTGSGRGYRATNNTPYRTYHYNANGCDFTVFY